ncbi:ABC transporter ATP-binding protein [Natranaerobius thermophilus]|uniref:Oligopeptide/dipeptide ABC transporter, ATPase subunit n=1 Tax=Natranaerobius thermophilus (strain ATCC BAA-1301 / DSM 18059 / JW/NM-WN-LF) TaxID=457570 RepID=B2A7Z3_NATTJ|nr:ABC transporter ATP-binding protein [Natranaerobius thermophilus]ACB85765.1 oligopeptide/dipeptide ABC transporter, ATPase subunit [Natranaerobius thermophilus JW/NM-WN-LF]
MSLLEVKNLKIYYDTKGSDLKAVDDISFDIPEGENLGLVGESGCGKTTAAKSIIRLLPKNGRIAGGSINYKGQNLAAMTTEEIRKTRWKEISMISQSAMSALNPVYKVGDQIVEAIRAHEKMPKKEAMNRAEELFDIVGLEKKRLSAYPHQMSGGMKQRAIIAMALCLDPGLIIADEPTTALDVVVQDRILNKIVEIQKSHGSSMVFITHDISVVAETCERTCVMYAGKIMELGPTSKIFKDPRHPYTMGLQNAFPSIQLDQKELISIPGFPPNLVEPPAGCMFYDRCPFCDEKCETEEPETVQVEKGHYVSCHYAEYYQQFRDRASQKTTWDEVKIRQQKKGVV